MTPNELELTAVFGPAKTGVLDALNASTRKPPVSCSYKLKCFKTETSRFLADAVRTSPMVRGTLPRVRGAGWVNAAVLKYLARRLSTVPPSTAFCPVTFGLSPGLNRDVRGRKCKWIAVLPRVDSVCLPAPKHAIGEAVPISPELFTSAERQIVRDASNEATRHIERGQ